jgi:outer membrane lipoprotein-sorting protein
MRRALALVLLTLVLVGCGSTPPQAPLPDAKKLDSSTSDISTACGEAAQVTEFEGQHSAHVAGIEGAAERSARKLASVYRRNPNWIYQGETVGEIVVDAKRMLGSCGLRPALEVLRRETRR